MDANKLMLDYFDEDITQEGEQDLFHSMAYDDALRLEFKNLMKIKNSLKAGFTGFAPSNNSTNVIFSKLGYSMPPVSLPVQVPGNFLTKMKPLYSYGSMALAASLITFIAAYFLFNPGDKSNYAGSSTNLNLPETVKASEAKDSKIAEIKSNQNDNKPIIKFIYINNNTNIHENQNTPTLKPDENNSFNNFQLTKSDYPASHDNMLLSNLNIKTTLANNQIIEIVKKPESSLTLYSGNKTGLSLEFRNSMAWNLPKETIYPSWISKFNNTGLTVLYDLSDNIKIGADVRQESFFVKYRGYDNFSQTILYEQQPNFFSYGLLARYSPGIDFNGFKPSIQAMIATNSYGLIGRGNLGIEYRLFSNLSLLAQAELSFLFFKHQSDFFTTRKFSINYGINYSF